MTEERKPEAAKALDAAELEQVTGGAAWNDDPEAIENIRKKESSVAGGIVTEPAEKTDPVAGAGILDRLALGVDRVREELTSIATRKDS